MPRRLTFGLATAFLLFFAIVQAVPNVEKEQFDGAWLAAARPENAWNGGLLVLAHGLRPESAPLTAEIDTSDPFIAALLGQGWMIATTSYRRNGVIVADAIEDLDRLCAWITRRHGSPRRVIVEGQSMGGLIATLLAERGSGPYAGVVAVGAALELREPSSGVGVNLQPRLPIVFLSNQTELEAPRRYTAGVLETNREIVRPAVFRVSRDGHVNVNADERLYAFRAVLAWLDRGRAALPPEARGESTESRVRPTISTGKDGPPTLSDREIHDATRTPPSRPSTVRLDDDRRGFTAQVISIAAAHGNILLDAQPADLETIGLRPGAYFRLEVGDRTFRVQYGRDFASVPRGHWVAFPGADGNLWLARNFANAAETASLAPGGEARIRRYDDAP